MTRVKCANCAMVYDRADDKAPSWFGQSGPVVCPKCQSNAADPVQTPRSEAAQPSGPKLLLDAVGQRDTLTG
ncbi:hypothetical protein UFOVP1382_46 [uncultured Caudovirales phage]|uniref:Uncharacterized protein n=1 Tax=uncultured Caudovirales phage TaxID=2100421 RepID=A0A6J5RXQ0_9CAUD|nr:hypothetical protein UFOVP1382_46 [uncultured Caudovirales phage]